MESATSVWFDRLLTDFGTAVILIFGYLFAIFLLGYELMLPMNPGG